MDPIPTKPYLLRALFEWCVDNGYTPHLTVRVDERAAVPSEYVKGGEITLNVSPTAVHKLQMGNDSIEFSARFGGVARQISVPVAAVSALYARETGHGMTFEIEPLEPAPQAEAGAKAEPVVRVVANPSPAVPTEPTEPTKPTGGKPWLRRVK